MRLLISMDTRLDVLLKITIKELIIIDMIYAWFKDRQARRILLRRNPCDFQRAPGLVQICTAECRDLLLDRSRIVRETSSQILISLGLFTIRSPIQRINGQCLHSGRNKHRLVHILRL